MKTRATELIVDLKKIAHNIQEIQKYIGKNVNIMPVVKAQGYGTHIDTQTEFFKELGIKLLAVACVDEGITIRRSSFDGNIVVINPCFESEIENALKNDLTLEVCDMNFIRELNFHAKNQKKICKIHLEINTGMNRTGINPNQIVHFIKSIKSMKNLDLEGIYTHFSSSDTNEIYTRNQIMIFEKCLKEIKDIIKFKYIHASNSGAVINFKDSYYNLVRPGIAIYGYLPDKSLSKKIDLIPAVKLKSKIVYTHIEPTETSVGYNCSYITKRKTKIAVIPMGYADGLPRNYSGNVIVKNKLAKVISVVNMDNTMIDVTEIDDVKRGDEVFLWDNKNITLESIAENCKTTNYEILSRISPRVLRRFEK